MSAPGSDILLPDPLGATGPDVLVDGLLAEVQRLREALQAAEQRAEDAEASATAVVVAALELLGQSPQRSEPGGAPVEPPPPAAASAAPVAEDDYFGAIKRSLEDDDGLGPRDDEPATGGPAHDAAVTAMWVVPRRRPRIAARRAAGLPLLRGPDPQ